MNEIYAILTFTPNKLADPNGTSLAAHCDGISMDEIADAFPEGRVVAYDEPEKGYSHPWEVKFTDENGDVYNIYERFGAARIGTNEAPGRRERSEQLARHLLATCVSRRNTR